ncbi:glycosyltransferase family 2 protein [Alkalimonas mucilaginosa]|uniref:Glycosyltransferase n=1 Tax=Alkalimonas mucilaginosa TaxID=3057676 RepID=A0ABU7JFL0_9GAMM|nr:glycosyltransferase [Alkalimonas sp. MEB004]MEE2024479.1 glycosyltransferase [Alkalimonas sp. MEB004]
MESLKVVIGIPTYKRPVGLHRLLDSIAKQSCDFTPIVLVADNEGDGGQGLQVAEQMKTEGYPWELHAIPVNERGISQVRNALMQYGFEQLNATHLAMIDDDEWVEPQWIAELVKVQLATGAEVVGGSVSPEFETERPDWAKGLHIYYESNPGVSGKTELIQGTTNVLLSRSIIENFPTERFDPFYSLVGGGDKEFFTRIKRLGASFAFAHQAQAHELFTASRLNKKWAIERAYRIGAGDMLIIKKQQPGFLTWVKEFSKLFFALILSLCLVLIYWLVPHKSMKARLKFTRQLGKLSALLGKQKVVYNKVHGS